MKASSSKILNLTKGLHNSIFFSAPLNLLPFSQLNGSFHFQRQAFSESLRNSHLESHVPIADILLLDISEDELKKGISRLLGVEYLGDSKKKDEGEVK